MRKLKQLLCFILIAILSLSTVHAFAISEDDAMTVLEDLGIMEKIDYPFFQPDFTRVEFAKVLTALSMEDTVLSYPESLATDTDSNEVNFVIERKLMDVDAEGKFFPNDVVTYDVAVKALVTLLGYSYEGCNYRKLARSLGITDNVIVKDYNRVLHGEIAKLVMNSLIIDTVAVTEGKQIELSDILTLRGIVNYEGRIIANDNVGMSAPECDEGYVNISGKIYKTDVAVPDNMVGRYVSYYVKTADDEKIISLYPNKRAEEVRITAKDINKVKFSSTYLEITYDKKEKLRIPYTANILVNGRPSDITSSLLSVFDSGEIIALDSNNDRNYDFVNMTVLKTDAVLNTSEWGERLVTEYNKEVVDFSNLKKDISVYKNGDKAALSTIKSGDIVGIACDKWSVVNGVLTFDYSNAERISFYVSDRQVVGTLETIESNGNYGINGRIYNKGSLLEKVIFTEEKLPLTLGESYVFKLDYFGVVSDYEIDTNTSDIKYGYLIDSYFEGRRELISEILTSDNKIEIYSYKDKFKLNSGTKKLKDLQTVPSVLEGRQVVRYQVRDGKIIKIETADTEGSSLSKDGSSSINGTDTPKEYRGKLSGFPDYKTKVAPETVVFFVPAPTETDVEDEDFSSGGANLLANGQTYSYDAYDIKDMGRTSCLVVYGSAAPISTSSRYYMVGDWRGYTDGIEGWELYGYTGKIKATFDPERVTFTDSSNAAEEDKIFRNITKGDLVRVAMNDKNEITAVERVFSVKAENALTLPGSGYSFGYGLLYNRDDTFFEFVVDRAYADLQNVTDSQVYVAPFMEASTGYIPIYDMREDSIITAKGDYSVVPSFLTHGEKVTVHMFWNSHLEMFSAAVYVWE